MRRKLIGFKLVIGAAAAITALAVSPLSAQTTDHFTTYATSQNNCAAGNLIRWQPGNISGPGFNCNLGGSFSAGTGLEGYQGTCNVNNQVQSGNVVLGLGIDRLERRFNIDVLGVLTYDMYPCTPVTGLNGTN